MWRLLLLLILLIPLTAIAKPPPPIDLTPIPKATPAQTMRPIGTPIPREGTPVVTPDRTRIARGAMPAALTGAWQPTGYLVTWSSPDPVCVTVQQPGGIETLAGECAASGSLTLTRSGDVALAADDGAIVRLRAAWGLAELARLEISAPYRVALPLVAAE